MTDDTESSLDDIAKTIGTLKESEIETEETAREGEDFDPEDYKRNKDDYDGGW